MSVYTVQGLYNGEGIVSDEWEVIDDETRAIHEARKLVKSPIFEGDYVRVICEGELVWDSREATL